MDSSTDEPQAGRDPETLRAYWQQQGERGAQLETQRLQVSNFVIASSVVALGVISASEDPEARVVIGIGVAVALFNTMAAIYSWRSDQWSGLYKERAKQILTENWTYLSDLEDRCPANKPHGGRNVLRRENMQLGLHVLIGVAAVILAISAG